MTEEDLILIKHPRSGELFKVKRASLQGPPGDLIPLYEINGSQRSRADAWLGSGRPADIGRGEALASIVEDNQGDTTND